MTPIDISSHTIVMPTDPELVAKLKLKLDEYEARWEPYVSPDRQLDTEYKLALMRPLVQNGMVDTGEVLRDLEAHKLPVHVAHFEDVCGVIEDYCKTGGANNHDGTGLPGA